MDVLSNVSRRINGQSRSVSAENFTGEKGKGGMSADGPALSCARDLGVGWKISPYFVLQPGQTATLADIEGPGIIQHIWITDCVEHDRKLILRIYWDGSDSPSVECPLGDFFASASNTQYRQLSSLAVCVNPKRAFNCYWEMPFRKRCRMTLESLDTVPTPVYYQVDYMLTDVPDDALYFHAQFRRVNPLPYKEVYTLLDNVSGEGQYVGTYMFWGVNNNGWWGEGEIKFYIDGDTEFPTICGTGTEDYFCGSHNFDFGGQYREFCTPYSGLAKVIRPDGLYASQQRFSMYRWHLRDPICFKKDIRVTIQALGWRDGGRYLPLKDDISSVSFWYQDSICTVFPVLPDADGLEIV